MVRETVSIIMPAYNASATIEQAVNSVIDQDFKDWHLYIIDDASHDNTFELAGKFQDERITVIKTEITKASRNQEILHLIYVKAIMLPL